VLEVVSKLQIMSESPAKRDYISDLNKLRYASRRRPMKKRSIRIVCEHFKEVCNAAIGH
jgi:hypothetical protein